MTSNPGNAIPEISVDDVSKMFPGVPVKNLEQNLPIVLQALADAGLGDANMILMNLHAHQRVQIQLQHVAAGSSV